MNDRANLRKNLGLTQIVAAARADVSLATWRRWEADPSSVAPETATVCEAVLSVRPLRVANDLELFERRWEGHDQVTPRQAYALVIVLGMWADEIDAWTRDPGNEPLHEVGPFASLDRRVMFYVGESRSFAAEVGERCAAIAEEIEDGIMPFMRPGRFIDEVMLGLAAVAGQDYLQDMPELFEGIAPRTGGNDEIRDTEWSYLSDWIDDEAYGADWELPQGLPMLPLLLEQRHPFTWFDVHREAPSYSLHRFPEDRIPTEDQLYEEGAARDAEGTSRTPTPP